MKRYLKFLFIAAIFCITPGLIQAAGEDFEPTPEEQDAAFTAADAARERALFSDEIIDYHNTDPVGRATDTADLVVRGRVKSQFYAYDAAGSPLTHTTIEIHQVLKGEHPNGEITLVQPGGPAKDNNTSVVLVSDVQYFNVGEQELLFLAVEPDSPYAMRRVTVRQRFRILGGQVFTVDGRGVTLRPTPGGKGFGIVLSVDRHPAPRFTQVQIGAHTLTKYFGGRDEGAPDAAAGIPASAGVTPGYDSSVDVDTFSTTIENSRGAGDEIP